MSKLMGKLILGKDTYPNYDLKIKFNKFKKTFTFFGKRYEIEKIPGPKDYLTPKERYEIEISPDLLKKLILVDKLDDVTCSWSYGYKTKTKLTNIEELRRKEYAFIRKETISANADDSLIPYDEYSDLSVWQYQFLISLRLIERMEHSKKSNERITLKKRNHVKTGGRRKLEGIDRTGDFFHHSELERVSYNKRVAKERNIKAWFIDAFKEECKLKHIKYKYEDMNREWLSG